MPGRAVRAALFGVALIAGACAPAAPPAPTSLPAGKPTPAPAAPAATTAPAAPAPAAQPRRGGTVVVAAATDPGHFNPAITTAGGTHFVADNLYNGLLSLDERLEPRPDLAERWTTSPDGRTYTFHLRQGVRWHDGQPFTSADVKFSFEEVLLKLHARTRAGLEGVLDGIDTPDPATVVFRFKQPYGPLLQRLDVVEAPIVARHVYQGQDPTRAEANLKPVGTGPFKLAEYVRGDRVRMVRNEAYFKPGLPHLDELVFRIIPQPSTSVLALEQGEVDYLSGVPGPDLPRLRQNASVTLAQSGAGSGGSFCQQTLIYNLSRTPLDRVEVRQALAHAIDRDQILEQVHFGQGRVAHSAIASSVGWAHNPAVPRYALDRERANQLLDQAGLRRGADGMRFGLEFVHGTGFAKTGELMQQHLAPLGISLRLTALETNAANDRTFIARDFDIGIASYCNGPDPEIGVRRAYVSSNIGPVLFSNGAGYRNPRVDALFDQAAASVDRQERARAYHEVQEILAREVPYWWLVETEGFRAWRKPFQGFFFWSGNLAEAAWQGAP